MTKALSVLCLLGKTPFRASLRDFAFLGEIAYFTVVIISSTLLKKVVIVVTVPHFLVSTARVLIVN